MFMYYSGVSKTKTSKTKTETKTEDRRPNVFFYIYVFKSSFFDLRFGDVYGCIQNEDRR